MRWHPLSYFLFLLCKHQTTPTKHRGNGVGEWDLLRPALLLLGNWGEENGWENSFHEGGVGNFGKPNG